MPTQLQAVFEKGVLRPLEPLALAEHQRVTITISENGDSQAAIDSSHFVLSAEQWDAFCAVLDRPPKQIPTLEKLLTHASENRRHSRIF
jgi:predicted DNA-binding antitoxin AbrB/MazE fold protein